jgi:hypothetical protein
VASNDSLWTRAEARFGDRALALFVVADASRFRR